MELIIPAKTPSIDQMKSIASLSLDLDDKWSYLQTHGDDNWKTYPSYLGYVVPRILEFLDRNDLKITFFIKFIETPYISYCTIGVYSRKQIVAINNT